MDHKTIYKPVNELLDCHVAPLSMLYSSDVPVAVISIEPLFVSQSEGLVDATSVITGVSGSVKTTVPANGVKQDPSAFLTTTV